jgi:hypothetical protein
MNQVVYNCDFQQDILSIKQKNYPKIVFLVIAKLVILRLANHFNG